MSARTIANFYVDALWFGSVDHSSVFWNTFWTKIFLGALFTGGFAVVAFFSLTLAERLAPSDVPTGPEREVVERFRTIVGRRTRLLRIAVSVVFGLFIGVPAMSQWQQWMLFRNAQSFGSKDAQFGVDVGFYVFRLPFLSYVVDWAFAALVLAMGSLSDRFGRRPALLLGLAGFGLASGAAALVDSASALIALRFVMGVFAALIFLFPVRIALSFELLVTALNDELPFIGRVVSIEVHSLDKV